MHLNFLIKNLILLKNDGIDYIPMDKTKQKKMEFLKKEVENCDKCPLHVKRDKTVFGEGNIDAQLMFIGEAPGANEDEQGKPFVGEAGKLLTKIIQAMNMQRKDVFIANIVKCRPPKNRDPLPEEISLCMHYLISQINIVMPDIICTLGRVSSHALLQSNEPISKIRGKVFDFHGIKVVPTFHPSHLLHHPENKKLVWQDMKIIMRMLESDSQAT